VLEVREEQVSLLVTRQRSAVVKETWAGAVPKTVEEVIP
jgi:hypothetical protein